LELSILHIFVNQANYNGIIKFSIKKEYHNLCISLETYKINTQVKETIEIFKNNLISDPNNPGITNIIPTKLVLKETFQLIECEKITDYLSTISTINGDLQEYLVDFGRSLKCTITGTQIKRIYNFFSTFVTNFAMLDSIYSLYINMLKIKEGTIDGFIKEKHLNLPAIDKNIIETPKLDLSFSKSSPLIKTEQTLLELILNTFTINNIIKSFIIHHIFNHLRFISNSIKIDKENTTITINDLYSNSFLTNNEYIISVLNTILNKDIESIINYNQKKILENIIILFDDGRQDSTNNLNLYILFFIFYIYQYRYIMLKHPDFDTDNYFKKETQQQGINYFIKNLSPSKIINVIVKDIEETDTNISDDIIHEISEKFKHLIPVSEESFLDLAVKEYNQEKNNITIIENFNLNNKKILNIDNIIQNEKIMNKVINQQSQTIITETYNDRSGLLNYKDKIITNTYHHFKEYISNPESIVLIKNIPKSVISLFDYFSRNISIVFKDKDIISTLDYYKMLFNNLPTPKSYSHYTYLFIIYNLIIPYYYDTYKINEFVDVFI